MRLLVALGLAVCLLAPSVSAQGLSPEEVARQLAELDAEKAALHKQQRRATVREPKITTDDDSIVLMAPGGKHVTVAVDGTDPVHLDELPKILTGYTDAMADKLNKSIQTTSETLAETLDKLIGETDQKFKSQTVATTGAITELDKALRGAIQAGNEGVTKAAQKALDAAMATQKTSTGAAIKGLQGETEKLKKTLADDVKKKLDPLAAKVTALETAPKKCTKETLGRTIAVNGELQVCTKAGAFHRVASEDPRNDPTNPIGTEKNPGKSCEHIKNARPKGLASGIFYVCTDKPHNQPNSQQLDRPGCPEGLKVFCQMDDAFDGGGYMLINTMTDVRSNYGGSRHPLTQNLNTNEPSLTKPYSRNWMDKGKVKRFYPANGDEFIIQKKGGDWVKFVIERDGFCGWDSRDKFPCSGCHGTYARGQIYRSNGDKINCGGRGCWMSGCNVCGGCNSRGCDTIAFQADKTDYAYTGGGGAWKVFGGSWQGGNCGFSWDRSKNAAFGPMNLFMRNNFGQTQTRVQKLIGSSEYPALSCAHIKRQRPNAPTGCNYYMKNSDRHSSARTAKVCCEMDTALAGGGWTLLNTKEHPANDVGGSRHPLTVDIYSNSPSFTRRYSRNWNQWLVPKPGDEFIMRAATGAWKRFVMTETFCGWSSRSSGICTGCHGTYAKGQIYHEDGTPVNCGGRGCWLNSCSVCGGCNSRGCDTIGFNADHADYAAHGGGSNWRLYGSGWNGNCNFGWGRRVTNEIKPTNLFYRPNGYTIDAAGQFDKGGNFE